MAITNQQPVVRLDRLLSNFALSYKLQNRVADFVAPPFGVARPVDKYAVFTKGNTFRVYDLEMSRGEEAKQTEIEHTDAYYQTKRYSNSTWIDDLDASNMDGTWKLDYVKTKHILDIHRLAREQRVFKLATNAAIVTQTSSPSTAWSAAGGTPISDILNAMDVVYKNSTVIPNAIIFPMSVALKAIQTAEWKDYFKRSDVGAPKLFDLTSGLRTIGLEPMIAGAFGVNTPMGSASDPGVEQLLGNNVILFHREQNPTLETRTFMYSPFCKEMEVIKRFIFQERHGYSLECSSVVQELMVDPQCGYLLTNCL